MSADLPKPMAMTWLRGAQAQMDQFGRTAMTDFAWLIEAPGVFYLGARTLGRHEFYWTQDNNKALRFFNSEQADQCMMAVRELNPDLFAFARNLHDPRPVEHGWLEQTTKPVETT